MYWQFYLFLFKPDLLNAKYFVASTMERMLFLKLLVLYLIYESSQNKISMYITNFYVNGRIQIFLFLD